jgi:hypothetical protein
MISIDRFEAEIETSPIETDIKVNTDEIIIEMMKEDAQIIIQVPEVELTTNILLEVIEMSPVPLNGTNRILKAPGLIGLVNPL